MLSILLLITALNSSHAAGPGDGGGGTSVRFEFQQAARRALAEIPRTRGLGKLPVEKLSQKLASAEIFVTDEDLFVTKNGVKQRVDALNFPKSNRIVINRQLWEAIQSDVKKESLALHELLSLLELEGTGNYKYSQLYYDANRPAAYVRFKGLMKPEVLNEVEDPKATIVVFEDFTSPFVHLNDKAIQEILKNFGDQVQIVIRNIPLTMLHKTSEMAALAGICASEQGKFAIFRRLYLDKMAASSWSTVDEFNHEKILILARSIPGLNETNFKSCLRSPAAQQKLDADVHLFNELKMTGTPASLLNTKDGTKRVDGARPYTHWEKLLKERLKQAEAPNNEESESSDPSTQPAN